MQPPESPTNEVDRLRELMSLGILDTPAEASFDDISELARHLAGTEIGIISLVDSDRQWFKSCVGLPLGQQHSPRSISFCGHTILQREPLIIEDAHRDVRFADNPLVQGEPWIRFYAGFPLITDNNFAIGSLCAISRTPHTLAANQIESLRRLAALTVQHLQNLRHSTLSRDHQLRLAPEMLPGLTRDDLRSLDQLISRDQMLKMLDLILAMETDARFALLRCRFRDYERVSATFGGLVAEEFINEGARRLIVALPKGASVARFADTELVVLLPFGVDTQDMQRVAERIIALTGQSYRNGQHSLSLAVSIGIATYHHNYKTVEDILSDASIAVQMARCMNGSSFRFVDAESRLIAKENYRIESDLRDALKDKLLDLYLQPIVSLADSETVGFEALARWQRGDQLLKPSSFIPMLAEAGLTAELDLLIVEKALAAMPLLARPIPQRQMRVSVNLSGLLLEDGEQQQRLLALIDDNPCPPGWSLQVEIVEDAFQAKTDLFERFLADLVTRGVVIAIDDFGTGYSSLARLISLPIQLVKVDQAFVQNLDAPADSGRTLLRTMIVMLRDLGLSITAEGVETTSQRDWLRAHAVSAAQGFLFHHPMPVSEAIALLETLDYRPRALAVDPQRLRAVRRRLRSNFWRRLSQDERRGHAEPPP
jgi:EAL domain-containing protein (putative c-di-GMP-specific phosphodiesterase class I)/GGDEF domain-containing protein